MPKPVPFRLACLFAAIALPAVALAAPAPLTLEEAVRIAQSRSAQLEAQRPSADASASLVGPASQNPDPKLIIGVENVPVESANKWSLTQSDMTMRRIGVMQDFVRGEKRELMGERAQAEARREAALVEMQAAEIRREVAMAFLDRLYAERSVALVDALAREAELQVAGTTARLAAGRGDSSEPVMARANLAMLADRRLEAERMAKRAEARLARWLGEDAKRTPAGEPDLDRLPNVAALTTNLETHPQIAMFGPMTAMAEAEAKLAAIATKPDWNMELSYGARGSEYTNMVTLMFRMDLPVFSGTRQEPAALARAKQAEQARAQAEEARRRYESEIRAAMVDYDIARSRISRNEGEIVPLAEARAKATLAAYEGGRGDLAMVLESRRLLLEARLTALNVRAEAARAWAQLAYLIPERSPK
jgi:outer membrane protein TolC